MLDRTWYDTLVDDDGSGLTGSVWDKADVNQLMNAIDAEFTKKIPATGTFLPTIGTTTGGTPIYAGQSGRYTRNGDLVTVTGRVSLSSKGSLAAGSGLLIAGFPWPGVANTMQSGLTVGFFIGMGVPVSGLGGYMDAGVPYCNVTYIPAAGGGGISYLTPSEIANTFDIIFTHHYIAAPL